MKPALSPTVLCKHCLNPIPTERRGDFCCSGCETVFHILTTAGLSDYYTIRDEGFCFRPAKPSTNPSRQYEFKTDSEQVKFFLEGIHCSACLWLLEKLPKVMPDQVEHCSLNLNTSTLTVKLRTTDSINAVASMIDTWGYVPHLLTSDREIDQKVREENRKRLLDLGIAGAIAGNVMLMSIPLYSGVTGSFETLFEWLSFGLAVPSLFYSGRVFFKNVVSGWNSKTFPIDAPILLALLVAFFYSTDSLIRGTHQLYFDSLTALIFLLLSSRYYLARIRQSSQMNLGILEFFQSDFKGKPQDLVFLEKGKKIQFDGIVRKGEGWCDHSQFTGESEPVRVQPGDLVYAGTLFVESQEGIWVEVLKTGQDTRLAHLLKQVSEVQSRRTQTEMKSDEWAKRLLIVVTTIAFFSMIYFVQAGRTEEGIRRVLALLIVTCPCALALATPLVFSFSIRSLLHRGILVKDPASLSLAPDLKEIYFDKTGTLTEGKLIARVDLSLLSHEDASALYSLVRHSRHPASRSVEREFSVQKLNVEVIEWSSFSEGAGLGIMAEGKNIYSLIRAKNSQSGLSESVFSKNDREICRIVYEDRLREETASTIAFLQQNNWKIHLLSGDQEQPVQEIAHQLTSPNQDRIEALSGQTPEQKAARVFNSIMVGDGINDALALSNAKIGIAVQGGMDAAIRSAQVYAMKPGIALVVPFLVQARKVRQTLRQNFILSTSYNLIGAVLSLGGWMNPLLAAILMPLSALTVFWSSVIRLKERG